MYGWNGSTSLQKGDRITPSYDNGDSLKQVLCLHRFICYSRYRLPNSFMNSMACMSHVPSVSIATGTKLLVSVNCWYLDVFFCGSMICRCTWPKLQCRLHVTANVSGTVTSQVKAFPLAQGISVAPSGRLPSDRDRLTGSFTADIWALLTALQIIIIIIIIIIIYLFIYYYYYYFNYYYYCATLPLHSITFPSVMSHCNINAAFYYRNSLRISTFGRPGKILGWNSSPITRTRTYLSTSRRTVSTSSGFLTSTSRTRSLEPPTPSPSQTRASASISTELFATSRGENGVLPNLVYS